MRLDKLREAEVAKRQGSTGRTIIQAIWLIISFAIAYFVSQWLFDQNIVTYNFFYNQLYIPRAVPRWMVLGGFMLFLVIIMQFFVMFGFFIGTPQGRQKSGKASAFSRNPDPFDNERH